MTKIRSLRGVEIDLAKLTRASEQVIAVSGGGQTFNGRGDILGKNGNIIKTAEQLRKETSEVQTDMVGFTKPPSNLSAQSVTFEELQKPLPPAVVSTQPTTKTSASPINTVPLQKAKTLGGSETVKKSPINKKTRKLVDDE